MCTPLLSSTHTICLVHRILLDIIARIIFGENHDLWCPSLCTALHSPITSSLLKPKYLLKTLFPSTLSLGTSLSASDKVSHTYKRTGTIIILYILTFIFWITNGRQNVLDRTVSGIPWVDCALNFFMNAVFISYGCSQIREYCRLSAVFVLWFCTASWTRDINMYLVFSASLLDHCPC